MKWGLNVFLKYLTPSVALRDSRLSSPLYISASSRSRFFSASPRFVSSSTPRFNQSFPLPAEESDVDSARHAPTNDSFDSFSYSDNKSPKSFSHSLIVGIVEVHKQYPLTRDLVHGKILYFYHAKTALRYHFVVVDMFFLWKPYVTRCNRHQTKTQNRKEFFLSWIVSDNEVKKI